MFKLGMVACAYKTPGLLGLKQEDQEFKTSLGYIRPCLKTTKQNKKQNGFVGNELTQIQVLCPYQVKHSQGTHEWKNAYLPFLIFKDH